MGKLTRAQIISQGLSMAGDNRLTTQAAVWLNAWLRSQYAGFPWPFLLREKTGIALAAGANSFELGAGSGGVTPEIKEIVDPLWIYNSTKTARQQVRVSSARETEADNEPIIQNSTTHIGVPGRARVLMDVALWGKWIITFDRWADKDYLASVKYYEQPADLASDVSVPLYPNDRTLMKAVEVEALRYKKDATYRMELEVLGAMVGDDKLKFGSVTGQNDYMDLDKSVFR